MDFQDYAKEQRQDFIMKHRKFDLPAFVLAITVMVIALLGSGYLETYFNNL